MSKVFFILLLGVLQSTSWAAKPMSPLRVVLIPDSEVVAHASLRVKVDVFSRISIKSLQVSLSHSSGFSLLAGEATQTLDMSTPGHQELVFDLQLDGEPKGQVSIEVSGQDAGGVRYAARDVLVFGEAQKSGFARGVELSPYVIRKRGNETLREYPLP